MTLGAVSGLSVLPHGRGSRACGRLLSVGAGAERVVGTWCLLNQLVTWRREGTGSERFLISEVHL